MSDFSLKAVLMVAALGCSTLLQGCCGIVENTNNLIKDTDTLIQDTNEQINLTAEQLRANMQQLTDGITKTLGNIDGLVLELTKDAGNISAEVVSAISLLSGQLAAQIQALGALQAQFQLLISQGQKELSGVSQELTGFLSGANDSMQKLNDLVSALQGALPKGTAARARVAMPERGGDSAAIRSAAEAYLATRGQAAGAPASASDTQSDGPAAPAAQMPAFSEVEPSTDSAAGRL